MKRICAWCKKELGETSIENEEAKVTHGICGGCAKQFFSKVSVPLKEFLDGFDEPIMLIGPDPKVITANKVAQEFLQKDLPQIEGYKGGEVIDCAYAFTEKGCGKDVHCESCTIRNTVLETFKTGESFLDIPAYPDIQKYDEVKKFCIKISTEKVNNFVLLRIDQLDEVQELDPLRLGSEIRNSNLGVSNPKRAPSN